MHPFSKIMFYLIDLFCWLMFNAAIFYFIFFSFLYSSKHCNVQDSTHNVAFIIGLQYKQAPEPCIFLTWWAERERIPQFVV